MPETKSPKPVMPRKTAAALKATKPPGNKIKSVAKPAVVPVGGPPIAVEPAYVPAIRCVHPLQLGRLDRQDGVLDRIAVLGSDHVLMAPPFTVGTAGNVFVTWDHAQLYAALGDGLADAAFAMLTEGCCSRGLTLLLGLVIGRVATDAPLQSDHPDWFISHAEDGDALDSRLPPSHLEVASFRHDDPRTADAILAQWTQQLRSWTALSIGDFRCEAPARLSAERWRTLIVDMRKETAAIRFLA